MDTLAEEKHHAQVALSHLTQKSDGTIKGRTIYNGPKTHEWLDKEDMVSPTMAMDTLFLIATINADVLKRLGIPARTTPRISGGRSHCEP